jgi:hypothetical protein
MEVKHDHYDSPADGRCNMNTCRTIRREEQFQRRVAGRKALRRPVDARTRGGARLVDGLKHSDGAALRSRPATQPQARTLQGLISALCIVMVLPNLSAGGVALRKS